MSFRFMSGTHGGCRRRGSVRPQRVSGCQARLNPSVSGRFLAVRAKPNSAVSSGFSAIGAKAKTTRVRDQFSLPVWSSAREPRNTTFAGCYEIETPLIWINASWAEAIYRRMLERGSSRRGRKFRPRCSLWSCGFQQGWVLRALSLAGAPVIAFD